MDPEVNIHHLCRLCGSKTQELQRINMFDSAGVLLEVKTKIKYCLGIDVNEIDNLPQVICTDCRDNVENYNKFKQNAIKTTDLLESLFTKQIESIENSQNNCNIDDDESVFDTANYISDPEELIIKADESDSFVDADPEYNPSIVKNKKKSVRRKRLKKSYKSSKKRTKVNLNLENNITYNAVENKSGVTVTNVGKRQKKVKFSSYECAMCEKTFNTRQCVYKHIIRHLTKYTDDIVTRKKTTKKANTTCRYCMKKFSSKSGLTKHVKNSHEKLKEFKIVLEKTDIPNSAKLDAEKNTSEKVSEGSENVEKKRKRIEKVSEFECDVCQKVFDKKRKIYRHVVRHLKVKKPRKRKPKPKCSYCQKEFGKKNDLLRHVKSKHERVKEPKILICHHCGKTYNDTSRFKYHLNTRHPSEYPFECIKCNKKFAIKELLRSHINNMHNENKIVWVCDICGKSLCSKNALTKHKLRHEKTPEEINALKAFICFVCNARYDHPCNLRYHMRMHTGETKFECNICNKKFIRKNALNVHILTHTGERNFVCDVCNKAFALKKNLDIHKLIHTGERPFQCKDCDKTYTQNSTLNIHLKKTGHTRKR